MKVVTFQGIKNVEVKNVKAPDILKPDDIIKSYSIRNLWI